MTAEEKQAIERLKICKTQRCEDKCAYAKWSKACLKALLEDIDTVLNLIEKQQVKIRHKDKEIKCLKCLHNTQVEIIDEMAETLKWSFNAGLGLIPSSICDCKGDIRKCEDKICTDCIKDYFKKKVGDK